MSVEGSWWSRLLGRSPAGRAAVIVVDADGEVALPAGGEVSPHNQYVKEAVVRYCHFPHPQQFAILITGRWGSGKTHFIDSIKD